MSPMTVIGCTGHRAIPAAALDHVTAGIRRQIARHDPTGLVGVSSLAAGADQLFAGAVLRAGARLRVVVPSAGYATTFAAVELPRYEALLAAATRHETLGYPEPSDEAFLAAGRRVVDLSDVLLAVWDRRPARGKGGTADIVAYAERQGVPVEVVWPEGIDRDP
jgi:hypothetical protein